MGRPRCEDCGERFNNGYNLELHRKHACSGGSGTGSESDQTAESKEGETAEPERICSRAEGTIDTFFEDKGYGFVVTADVTAERADGTEYTRDVFLHISSVHTDFLDEGDRLRFDVLETEDGLEAENATVLQRASEQDDGDTTDRDSASRPGFGQQKDDRRYGRETGPTEQDIESFEDERKFR